jgi:hypothetical protein
MSERSGFSMISMSSAADSGSTSLSFFKLMFSSSSATVDDFFLEISFSESTKRRTMTRVNVFVKVLTHLSYSRTMLMAAECSLTASFLMANAVLTVSTS